MSFAHKKQIMDLHFWINLQLNRKDFVYTSLDHIKELRIVVRVNRRDIKVIESIGLCAKYHGRLKGRSYG